MGEGGVGCGGGWTAQGGLYFLLVLFGVAMSPALTRPKLHKRPEKHLTTTGVNLRPMSSPI